MIQIQRRLLKSNPTYWTLGIVLCTIVITWITTVITPISSVIAFFTLIGLVLFTILTIMGHIVNLQVTSRYLYKLSLLYLELIVLFAVAYFWMVLLPNEPAITNITSIWEYGPRLEGRHIILNNIPLSVMDIVHFSVVTMTTLGYGDMLPNTWYSKLTVDLQVLLGLGIIVIGIGKYFNQTAKQENQLDS